MAADVEKVDSERAWWMGSLPYLLVVLLATGSFGLIGGLVVAGVVWWMGRWRRVQVVAFWLLIPCLLLTFLVAQSTRKQRAHEVATAVLAPSVGEPAQPRAPPDVAIIDTSYIYDDLDPKNPKNHGVVPPLKYEQHPRISAAGTKDWDVSVAMFMAANPSVMYANNGVIFDEKLAENASAAMTDADRLRTAYFAAVEDSQWKHRPVGADLWAKTVRGEDPRCVQWDPNTGGCVLWNQPPTTTSKATPEELWNAAVAAFYRDHPALYYRQNTQIIQEKLDAIGGTGQTNQQLLDAAYAAAVNDSRWSSVP